MSTEPIARRVVHGTYRFTVEIHHLTPAGFEGPWWVVRNADTGDDLGNGGTAITRWGARYEARRFIRAWVKEHRDGPERWTVTITKDPPPQRASG